MKRSTIHKFIIGLMSLTSALAQNSTLTLERSSDSDVYLLRLEGVDSGSTADWRIQVSPDLANWSDAEVQVDSEQVWAWLSESNPRTIFFRAVRVAVDEDEEPGLYDPGAYRVMSLEFDEQDWQAQLTTHYGTDTQINATLVVDGVGYAGVGVRYKGDTSYRMATTAKKSFAIEIDASDPELRLMGYKTLNLNNAFSDASFMREVLYNNFCREYMPSPKSNLIHLYVNGEDYGVYVNAQQENGDMVEELFADNDGDRWRAGVAPNAGSGGLGGVTGGRPVGGPPTGGQAGGGGFSMNFGGDLNWLGSDVSLYESGYILKTDNNPEPWAVLMNTIDVLNNTALEELPEKIDSVLAVDRFLWMLALENLFLDGDGYLAKAGDYLLYHDINTGRLHPIQHDGNETFNADSREIAGGVSAEPLYGEFLTEGRPLAARLFAIDAYRQRYLAHLRTILNESFHWDYFEPRIADYVAMIESDVLADSIKQTSDAQFLAAIDPDRSDLRAFVEERRTFLLNHAEVNRISPTMTSVTLEGGQPPAAGAAASVRANVGSNVSVRSATLYYTQIRDGSYSRVSMNVVEGLFVGELPGALAGTTVYYYVEVVADDEVGTRAYFPSRAEGAPLSYQVGVERAEHSLIVINEIMAKNSSSHADADGDYDDWIELHNLGDVAIDLSGMYLSDKEDDPRKWMIPEGTEIAPQGYLIVWADEDSDQEGLHANFKLSSDGESVYLIDSDARGNLLLDSLSFGALGEDVTYGRLDDEGNYGVLTPSPGYKNE